MKIIYTGRDCDSPKLLCTDETEPRLIAAHLIYKERGSNLHPIIISIEDPTPPEILLERVQEWIDGIIEYRLTTRYS